MLTTTESRLVGDLWKQKQNCGFCFVICFLEYKEVDLAYSKKEHTLEPYF
jgi:hypothetical protein